MNMIIAVVVGGLAATAVTLGGVHIAQGDQSPVAKSTLSTYASH